jgi:hypothetical protein
MIYVINMTSLVIAAVADASADFDPLEETACCGFAIGAHALGGPCPTEFDASLWWGR